MNDFGIEPSDLYNSIKELQNRTVEFSSIMRMMSLTDETLQ